MAICSPYAGPALIERSEKNDQGGLLADMFRAAQDRAGTILTRENFDPRWMKQFQRQMRRIGEMSPYNWDELTAYYQKKGWLGKLDECARTGPRGLWRGRVPCQVVAGAREEAW